MRKIFVNTVILTFSFLMGVLILEIVLREFFPVYLTGIGAYKYDEKLGVRLKPNIHFFKTTDYQQEVHTNKIGTVNFQESFDGYDALVFAIGDSYTQGTGLPSDATYPFQLDTILNMKDGKYIKKYAVINLGLAAFGGEQALLSLLIHKEILGKPAYILYLGYFDNYIDDILFTQGYRHKHLVEGNPNWGIFLKPAQWLTNETEIGKRLKLAIGTLRRKSYIKDDSNNKQQTNNTNIAQLQEPILNKALTVSKDLNAQLIVSWADPPENPSGSYQWLKQWANERNVAFADWHPKVESVLAAIPKLPTTNQHSGGHFRTWVNAMIAKSFAEQIQK